jgi:hypothetical protein
MHFITGKHMPRRTFLRGVGVTVALPFLDAMVPSGFGRGLRAATKEVTRLVCIEEVHGLAGCNNWGASQYLFAPKEVGRDFTLVPDNPFSTVEQYREYMTIVSNTDVRMAEAFTLSEIGGDHFRSSAVFLTHAHPKQTQGSDIWAGTSFDQLYAKKFGQANPLPSASRTWTRRAVAPTTIPASTPIRSAGRRRTSRCRWFATRVSPSRCCSARGRRKKNGVPAG